MDKILDDVRKDACPKLRESETEDLTVLVDTAIALIQFFEIARLEGHLALDEPSENLKSEYGRLLMKLIVDGTDPDIVLEIGTNKYWMKNPQGLESMVCYFYLRGILHIQSYVNTYIIALLFRTLLPERCQSLFREKVRIIMKNRDLEIAEKVLHFPQHWKMRN